MNGPTVQTIKRICFLLANMIPWVLICQSTILYVILTMEKDKYCCLCGSDVTNLTTLHCPWFFHRK